LVTQRGNPELDFIPIVEGTLLRFPLAEVRLASVWLLAHADDPRACAPLLGVLEHDPDYDVREAAGNILVGLARSGNADRAVPRLYAIAKRWKGAGSTALNILVWIGNPEAVAALERLLFDKDLPLTARTSACEGINRLSDKRKETLPILIRATKDGDPDIRLCAVQCLGDIRDIQSAPALRDTLADSDSRVRIAGAFALYRVTKQAEPSVRALCNECTSGDHSSRALALRTIGEIGPNAASAIPTVLACLQDKNPRIRLAALNALAAQRASGKEAISSVERLLNDPDPTVAKRAHDVLEFLKLQ
jgi:HEAT repeat protein